MKKANNYISKLGCMTWSKKSKKKSEGKEDKEENLARVKGIEQERKINSCFSRL